MRYLPDPYPHIGLIGNFWASNTDPVLTDPSRDRLRVEQAAAWLDVRHPGWVDRIDLTLFNMHDTDTCIGAYLDVDWQDLAEGFRIDTHYPSVDVFREFTSEWRRAIEQRLRVVV